MMASGHIVVGLATYHGLRVFYGYPPSPISYGMAVLGSLLPDIDHPYSQVGKALPTVSHAISRIFGHRGITHSIFAVFLFTWLVFYFGEAFSGAMAALCVGYLSHLLGDFMTHSGIPLLWPWRQAFRLPMLHFRTGGGVETCIILLLSVLLAYDWVYG